MKYGASIAIEVEAPSRDAVEAILDLAADAILALPGVGGAWVEFLESEKEMKG